MITDDWGPDEFLAISRFMKVTVTNNEKVTVIFKIKVIAMLDYSVGLERNTYTPALSLSYLAKISC